MVSIAKNLKQILTAVYGRDVRQAIHDGIQQCSQEVHDGMQQCDSHIEQYREEMEAGVSDISQTVAQVKEATDLWAAVIMEDAETEAEEGFVWAPSPSMSGLLIKTLAEAEGGNAVAVKLDVAPGETYWVAAVPNSYYAGALGCPAIAAVYQMVEGQYMTVCDSYAPMAEGENNYLVKVPDGSSCLLVNSDGGFPVRVQKIKAGSSSSGMKILWSGLLNCDGYVGLNNEGVEFSIPKDCFFDDGKELILAINGYCPEDDYSTFPLLITGMCFGTDEDFGLSPNSNQYPYHGGNFNRYILHEEKFVTESSGAYSLIRIDIHVKKVPDSRYAVCTVQNRSSHFYITSISAVLAG